MSDKKRATIWKFHLTVTDEQELRMPQGAKPLSVQVQQEYPCLWALVDPAAPIVAYTVKTYGTGQPGEFSGSFVGTYQLHEGSLVFHVFI